MSKTGDRMQRQIWEYENQSVYVSVPLGATNRTKTRGGAMSETEKILVSFDLDGNDIPTKEFMTEVMLISCDEEVNHVQCQIFLGGQALFEENEEVTGE